MKRVAVLLALLALPSVAGESYVHVGLQPDFIYQDNQDVKVKLQAMQVLNDVPTDAQLSVSVLLDGRAFELANQGSIDRGVSARTVTALNFGRLEAGSYEAQVTVSAGSYSRTRSVDLAVTKPPVGYTGTLEADGRDAVFLFHTGSEELFTIRTYYNGPLGRTVLHEERTNGTAEVRVEGLQDTVTLVEVEGPNGWLNHANRRTNILTGDVETSPWTWFPDVENTEQWQSRQLVYGIVLVAVGVGLTAYGMALHYREKRRFSD